MSSLDKKADEKRAMSDRDPSFEDGSIQHSSKRQREDPPLPPYLERAFVEAVYKVGLQCSSPNAIIENMTLKSYDVVGEHVKKGCDVSAEHVKSHLQKHRKKPVKAVNEFMSSYDSTLSKLDSISPLDVLNKKNETDNILKYAIARLGCKTGLLLSGEPAAFLTFCSNPFFYSKLYGSTVEPSPQRDLSDSPANITVEEFHATQDPLQLLEKCTSLSFPVLTEDEKNSSLGRTLAYIIGMFDSFKQHILINRRRQYNQLITELDNRITIKRNPVQNDTDLVTSASIKPTDMDDMSNNYFIYEPSQSSLIRMSQPGPGDSLSNENRYYVDPYRGDEGSCTTALMKMRANCPTPRIENCHRHLDQQAHGLIKPDDSHSYQLPYDADDRSIQHLVMMHRSRHDYSYSSIFPNNSMDSMKADFDQHFQGPL